MINKLTKKEVIQKYEIYKNFKIKRISLEYYLKNPINIESKNMTVQELYLLLIHYISKSTEHTFFHLSANFIRYKAVYNFPNSVLLFFLIYCEEDLFNYLIN